MVAEIGLEELNGLEMEVMRRQASVQDPLGGWRQNHGVLGWLGPPAWRMRNLSNHLTI